MIWVTSEDEQLLQKAVTAMRDYLHIAHFFNLRTQFASAISYLCSVTPSLFEAASSLRSSSSQQPLSPLEGDLQNDIRVWKCLNSLRLLLQSVSQYSTFLEKVPFLLSLYPRNGRKSSISSSGWTRAAFSRPLRHSSTSLPPTTRRSRPATPRWRRIAARSAASGPR